jgi:hypothetical protein
MAFRYRSHQITAIVAAPKVVREGQALKFEPYKIHSLTLALDIDLKDGALINLRFIVTAGQPDLPESYHAVLLLDDSRIRGIDHQLIPRRRFYRIAIPAGWHQNIIDPNLSGDDANRHEPLADFNPTDLDDFLHKVAALWHIELTTEPTLL